MTKDFSCRTCKNLYTDELDTDGKAVISYYCELLPDVDFYKPGRFFCADHTDREAVKRIREGI